MLFNHQTEQNLLLKIQDVPSLQIESNARILIIAPHPDDETLAAGGLIASAMALRPAPQIRVLVATNGDASYLTAIRAGMNALSRRNFQHIAVKRQQETLSALIFLGLDAQQIHFWGFPDRGLDTIWQSYWMTDSPYRSSTTGYYQSEQAVNVPLLPYTGESLMNLFQTELSEFQPTIVILPDPKDAHPDHRALARFTLLCASFHQKNDQNPPVEYLAYKIWQPGKFGVKAAGFIPAESTQSWQCLQFSPKITEQKGLALKCYRSQQFSAGQSLRNAARKHYEIFYLQQPYLFSTQENQ